ncbi:hypothetical protein PIB30_011952 [Stylosanthes scabra]|uniref:Uncharacterized protein n=1 Tax=Stylosanthes scabra TaxID=79078 RepID=A0ABU6W417_9FABA|nr:hypothetical protein [Stylosanthes scabra]
MDSIRSAENQGSNPHEETLQNLKKLVISSEKEMKMEIEEFEGEDCKTPTLSGNMIPSPLKCPPPKKPSTPPPSASKRGTNEGVTPEEIEEFFKTANKPLVRVNNEGQSI